MIRNNESLVNQNLVETQKTLFLTYLQSQLENMGK